MKPVRGSGGRIPVGVSFAIASALLFGLSTPCAKLLLGEISPLLLAGLLYAGSGLGLSVIHLLMPASAGEAPLTRADVPWLAGAIAAGGIFAPVLLMSGLRATPASAASLLLNLEGVFTALLAWFVFRENFDRRIALGMTLIVAGGALLSWQPGEAFSISMGALAVAAACLCWGIDNNVTQKVSTADPVTIAAIKGSVAGTINIGMALATGTALPEPKLAAAALAVGLIGYGASLALYVLGLRHLGTARTGAYFSVAPFVGAAVSLALPQETAGPSLVAAGMLMAAGMWLHLTERHEHEHHHEPMAHSHRHVHDEHHRHEHAEGVEAREPHTHWHEHEPLTHTHLHYPDIHHRHPH